MMTRHKSGQAALIIVIVTMVTALGIAVSSATQSNINLRETVYSTQSAQALACAEAGSERTLAAIATVEEVGDVYGSGTLLSTEAGYEIEGCTYSVTITDYPCTGGSPSQCDGSLVIPNLNENAVQEIKVNGDNPSRKVNIKFNNNGQSKASLAVYFYKADSVDRKVYHCGSPPSPNSDFNTLGTGPDCTVSEFVSGVKVIRFRPLYTNMSITVTGDVAKSGYLIQSTGAAGSIQRNISVYRFFSQLPAVFDEAVVSFGSGSLE